MHAASRWTRDDMHKLALSRDDDENLAGSACRMMTVVDRNLQVGGGAGAVGTVELKFKVKDVHF